MTLIGGHSAAGTPAPQGAAWFSSTQLSAASAPMMNRPAPVERETSFAPGAAPWSCLPLLRVTGLPATMPLTWVPWPPTDRVSVSTVVGHLLHRAERLERVAQGLEVGDHGAAAVGLLEVRVGGVDAGVDDRDAHAVAGELLPVGPGQGLGGLVAAGGDVAGVLEEVDRPGCPRRRSRRAPSAPPGPGCRCRWPPRRRSCRSWSPRSSRSRRRRPSPAAAWRRAPSPRWVRRRRGGDSWVARWDDTSARSPDSAALAVVGATRLAEATSAAAPTARVVLIRTIASLHAPSRRCGATRVGRVTGRCALQRAGPVGVTRPVPIRREPAAMTPLVQCVRFVSCP